MTTKGVERNCQIILPNPFFWSFFFTVPSDLGPIFLKIDNSCFGIPDKNSVLENDQMIGLLSFLFKNEHDAMWTVVLQIKKIAIHILHEFTHLHVILFKLASVEKIGV